MAGGLIARASLTIHATVSRVWDGLLNPALIHEYMIGTEVISEWKDGSPITWSPLCFL